MHPGIVFATFFVLNFFIWGKHSSGAVSDIYVIYMYVSVYIVSLSLCIYIYAFLKRESSAKIVLNIL